MTCSRATLERMNRRPDRLFPVLDRWLFGPLVIACLLTSSVLGQSPPFSVKTTADGLPSNTIYGMLQDRDGYMWFGTDAGLVRYDGRSFRTWTTSDGLTDNEVLSMFEDPLGRIWCITLNGRLCYIQAGNVHGIEAHPEFQRIQPPSGLMGMAVDDQGYYWFGGLGGELYSWRNGEVRTYEVLDRSSVPAMHGMALPLRTGDGSVRIIVNGSLYACKDGEPVFLRTWGVQPTGIPMVSTHGGQLVAHGANGPLILRDSADVPLALTAATVPSSYRPPCMLKDGTMCHSTGAYGIQLRYPLNTGRPSRSILDHFMVNMVLEDHDQNMWCSTDGQGIVLITRSDRELTLLGAHLDQRQRTVSAVLVHRSGDVVFGTASGAILRLSSKRVDTLVAPPVPLPSRDRVRDLQEAADGSIWFTTDRRAGRITLGENPTLTFVGSIDERLGLTEVVRDWGHKSIATGADGTVMASAFGLAMLEHGKDGPFFAFRKRYYAGHDRIYAPHVMPDGTIWFEIHERLHRLRKNDPTRVPFVVDGLEHRITDLDALEDGTLVIATAGSGTMLFHDGAVIARFDTRNGAPSDQCRAAVVRDGRVLVATDAGAYVVEDPLGSPHVQVFHRAAPAPVHDVMDIDGDHQHLYLATPDGLCIVPLPLYAPAPMKPMLHIEHVLVNDSVQTRTDTLHMMLGDRFTIALTGLAFTAPDHVIHQWAPSSDGPWLSTGPHIQFNGSTAGTHRFFFRAALPNGPWSNIRSMTVIVTPPWYRTTWALAVAALGAMLLVVFAIALLFRARIRRHKNALLRELAKQEERQRIAGELHDDLGADISHLLMLARQTIDSPGMATKQREQLSGLESHAQSLMHKVDEIIWSLDPRDDEMRSALVFIQRYAERFAETRSLRFRTQALTDGEPIPCSSQQRRDLFLAVKELLHNIVKHNVVGHLLVVMRIEQDTVHIVIEDDGVPINQPPTNGRNGHGKANIKLRLERLKATLLQEPMTPVGTRTSIIFHLP